MIFIVLSLGNSLTHLLTQINNPMRTKAKKTKSDRKKVLIIKPGYNETFDPDITGIVSLGDILRTTVILHKFPPDEYEITWLMDNQGIALVKNNPYIHRILKITPFTPFLLMNEWFDIVINLEKDPAICVFADKIPSWKKFGFRYDPRETDRIKAYEHSEEALLMAYDEGYKKKQTKSWSEMLYNMLGEKYEGQNYLLGYAPKTVETYDVGFNHEIGIKFPLKGWSKNNWKQLECKLSDKDYSISWQQSKDDIEGYIDWINSCKTIVTNDSLGLHLALALNKNVVALFGPTMPSELHDNDKCIKLTPKTDWECVPCLETICTRYKPCMSFISVDDVIKAVDTLNNKK